MLIGYICNAQISESDKQAMTMLKEFYRAYGKLSLGVKDRGKIDSLYEIYCTPQLRNVAIKYLKDGHDLLTDDFGFSEESLNSLTITKHIAENTYVVSYNIYETKPSKSTYQVTLSIKVKKDANKYKIDSIK